MGLEGYTAFFPFGCRNLGTCLDIFNLGDHLCIPGTSFNRGFLPPSAARADGQATLCVPQAGQGPASNLKKKREEILVFRLLFLKL